MLLVIGGVDGVNGVNGVGGVGGGGGAFIGDFGGGGGCDFVVILLIFRRLSGFGVVGFG